MEKDLGTTVVMKHAKYSPCKNSWDNCVVRRVCVDAWCAYLVDCSRARFSLLFYTKPLMGGDLMTFRVRHPQHVDDIRIYISTPERLRTCGSFKERLKSWLPSVKKEEEAKAMQMWENHSGQ